MFNYRKIPENPEEKDKKYQLLIKYYKKNSEKRFVKKTGLEKVLRYCKRPKED